MSKAFGQKLYQTAVIQLAYWCIWTGSQTEFEEVQHPSHYRHANQTIARTTRKYPEYLWAKAEGFGKDVEGMECSRIYKYKTENAFGKIFLHF